MIIKHFKTKGSLGELHRYFCGVLCKGCGWRGWRVVRFHLDLYAVPSKTELANLIKGKKSYPSCPKCSSGTVVFTHTNLRNAR